jgi:hypothetical protein
LSQTYNPSCLDYQRLKAADPAYWLTLVGLTRRIDMLSQDFSYRLVNNACKITANTNKAEWLKWEDKGDAKVCPTCQRHSKGGKNGYYKTSWFLPKMPAHPGCRCKWKILFYNPFGG